MAQIQRLERSKRVRGRYLVWLDDGTMLRATEQEVLDFALRPGLELGEEETARLRASSSESAAKARAARMIGARPLAKRELVDRLVAKGEGAEQAACAADWLEELGAVDDRAYAAMLVRHYDARGYGPQRLREELRRRKVPAEYWEEALAGARPEEEVIEQYLERRLSRGPVTEQELGRQANALRRRGFSWRAIRSQLDRWQPEPEETW